jgi:hypothetical protein
LLIPISHAIIFMVTHYAHKHRGTPVIRTISHITGGRLHLA